MRENNVKLDCMIRGETLSFMQPSDIYSLFGDAIDNAIEAVCKINDPDKRTIGVSVRVRMGLIIIHVENYYEGKLSFRDGVPETTKDDDNYHGFGVKSIRMVSEKYNGKMTTMAKNGIFYLIISIPEQQAT